MLRRDHRRFGSRIVQIVMIIHIDLEVRGSEAVRHERLYRPCRGCPCEIVRVRIVNLIDASRLRSISLDRQYWWIRRL